MAKSLELSSSTIQRCRREIKMLSTFRIPPSSKTNHTRKQKTPNTNLDDVKVTSTDLAMTSNESNTKSKKRKKINLKTGSIHDNIEINEKLFDEIIHNNYL